MATSSEFKYSINSVRHAVKLIEIMARNNCEMSFSEIRNAMDLPKGTVFRLLGTLKELGYIEQVPNSRTYIFSLQSFELSVQIANTIGEKTGLHTISPILKALSSEFNEMISFVILDRYEILFIYCINSNRPLKLDIQMGSRQPAYCSAHGRILLAFLPPEELDNYFRQVPPVSYTPDTITNKGKLKSILEKVRRDEYCIVREELIPGVSCISVPVRNKQGKVCAAIGVNIPTARLSDSLTKYILSTLQEKTSDLRLSQQSMAQIIHITS